MPTAPAFGATWKALLFGVLTDVGGSIAVGAVAVFFYSIYLASAGVKREDFMASMTDPEPFSFFGIATAVIGYGFSILGGFVCARVAKRREYALGAALAAIDTVLGLVSLIGDRSISAHMIVSMVVAIPCVLVGAHFGRMRNLRLYPGLVEAD